MFNTIPRKGIVQTVSGKYINVLHPLIEDIDIEYIAHHLSMICRFNGASRQFYSVAEHCFMASCYIEHKRLRKAALLHDAAEAYVGDLISPLKNILPEFKEIEEQIQTVIFRRFDVHLSEIDKKLLKDIDLALLATEKRDLMPHDGSNWAMLNNIQCLPISFQLAKPSVAKEMFLGQAKSLGIR